VDDDLLNALRYKSEGTEIDFKSAQYRFVNGIQDDKAEMLKDFLAMANAWRDGTGYILLGFRDQRPHPAEVVGITGHIDDAAIQQFVNGKVKPKLTFRYEEHLYEGKTVGVISIPKQKRPFYLAHDFGRLRSNVVYVRRGSSTDEAEPPEVAAMVADDSGRGAVQVKLSVLTSTNVDLPEAFTLDFLQFAQQMPDYEKPPEPRPTGRFGLPQYEAFSVWRDNHDFWRESAEHARIRGGLVEMQFALRNRSQMQLSNAKLEVMLETDDVDCTMYAGSELPDAPKSQWSTFDHTASFPDLMGRRDADLVIDESGDNPACHVRFGALLPGEEGRSGDTLALVLGGPGKLRLKFRILAAELPAPIESEREIETSGTLHRLDFEGIKDYLRMKWREGKLR
jgi:hypothetical protein